MTIKVYKRKQNDITCSLSMNFNKTTVCVFTGLYKLERKKKRPVTEFPDGISAQIQFLWRKK